MQTFLNIGPKEAKDRAEKSQIFHFSIKGHKSEIKRGILTKFKLDLFMLSKTFFNEFQTNY